MRKKWHAPSWRMCPAGHRPHDRRNVNYALGLSRSTLSRHSFTMQPVPGKAGVIRFLERRSPRDIGALAFALIVLLAAADYETGGQMSFSVFYLFPVSIAAWFGGRWLGVAAAVASAIAWHVAKLLAGGMLESLPLALANTGARLAFLLSVALVLSALRQTVLALNDALEREQALSRNDPLTCVLNARAFAERGQQELRRSARYSRPLTVVYMDVDDFKSVNDRLGHLEGDRLLKVIAHDLCSSLRTSDIVARLGGDEFALLLPETDASAATATLVKVRAGLAAAMVREGWDATFSMGAVTRESAVVGIDRLLERADALMYQVKRSGKNGMKVELFETPDLWRRHATPETSRAVREAK